MKLGDRVTVGAVFVRDKSTTINKWVSVKTAPREGIYIGRRTLWNGRAVYVGAEDGIEFRPTEHLSAVLVVFTEHQNPRYVPMDAMQKAGGGE
jgi:hypothetical protein